MTDTIARQPRGIPAGGQFSPNFHAEPEAGLTPPLRTHGKQRILDALRLGNSRMQEIEDEQDRLHLQGAVESIRRDFPDAVVLRAKTADGHLSTVLKPVGLQDAEGGDATGGEPNWFYRGSAEGDMTVHIHLDRLNYPRAVRGEEIGYDMEAGEYLIPVRRDYWTGPQA